MSDTWRTSHSRIARFVQPFGKSHRHQKIFHCLLISRDERAKGFTRSVALYRVQPCAGCGMRLGRDPALSQCHPPMGTRADRSGTWSGFTVDTPGP